VNDSHEREWAEWLMRYQTSCRIERGIKEETIHHQSLLLEKFFLWCRDLGLAYPRHLSPAILSDYRRFRIERVNAKGRRDEPSAVNRHLMALRKFLGYLKTEGAVPSSLVAGLPYLKQPRRLPRNTLLHGQVMKLLAAVPLDSPIHLRDRAILELFYSSAIRRQELSNLELADVDYENGLVRINQGKGGKDRMVPVGAHALRWLKNYVESARPALTRKLKDLHAKLFVSRSGRPLHRDNVSGIVRRCGRRAKLDKPVGPHVLRRSCATELIRNGASPGPVKDILGHEDFQSLSHYVHLVAADLKEAVRRFHPRERAQGYKD
jgi:integrase/recombinase XerD